jgi:flagellar hook-associated protein 2
VEVDSSGTVTAASVDGDTSLFEIDGTRIKGKSGTAYEGFSFSFSGSSTESIDITLSYGLAERVYSDSNAVGNTSSGTLKSIIDNIEEQDSDLSERSSLIRSQAETYRTALTARYAKIQEQILTANSTISYLKILTDSSD